MKTSLESLECPICTLSLLETTSTKRIEVLFPCHHAYHKECINQWFEVSFPQTLCCLCRKQSIQGQIFKIQKDYQKEAYRQQTLNVFQQIPDFIVSISVQLL